MAELKHVAKGEFQKDVMQSDKPVLVDFFATWCGPCKMLGPILEQVADETQKVRIVKVDIDENMDVAQQYGLMSVPTLILFNKGKEIAREVGFRQKTQILELIDRKIA